MQLTDILNLGAQGVKQSPEALDAYKRVFQETFGRLPECPTCGSSVGVNDWNAFTALANGQEVDEIKKQYFNMTQAQLDKTFTVYNSHDLVHYVEYRNDRAFVERSYINSMSEEFAIRFLETAETEEELEKRKKYFAVLPSKFRVIDEVVEADELLNLLDETIIDNESGIVKNDIVIEKTPEKIKEEPIQKTPEQIKEEKNAKRREAYKKNKEA